MAEYRYEVSGPAATNGLQFGSAESAAGAWYVVAGIAEQNGYQDAAESLRERDVVGKVVLEGSSYAVRRVA